MRARVWNRGPLTLKEMFKGEPLEIKAGEFVEMEFYDAHEYKGQYRPINTDAGGFGTPESFKMVEVVKIVDGEEDAIDVQTHKCMSCSKTYESEKVLKAHCEEAHETQETLVIPDMDREIQKKKGRPAKVA